MKVPVLGGFLNGLLGNTVTNFTTFFSGSVGNSYGTMLGAGPTMLPLPSNAPTGLQGPTGVLIGAVAKGAGEFVGASKALLDGAIYLEGYNYCKTGKY
jgi:hypothetical protein